MKFCQLWKLMFRYLGLRRQVELGPLSHHRLAHVLLVSKEVSSAEVLPTSPHDVLYFNPSTEEPV